jgi:hypothetical protein
VCAEVGLQVLPLSLFLLPKEVILLALVMTYWICLVVVECSKTSDALSVFDSDTESYSITKLLSKELLSPAC